MSSKHVLLVAMVVFVAVVWLTSCNVFSPENRAEVLTQQNCPPQMGGYRECATNCGNICKQAGVESRGR